MKPTGGKRKNDPTPKRGQITSRRFGSGSMSRAWGRMTGEQIKRWLCEELRKAHTDPPVLKDIRITNSTGDAKNLWDLIGDSRYELFCDNSD